MKSVDWHAILDSHPLFKSLDRQERELLLSKPFSKEHKYREGSVILKEGETGNSLFLIGAGAVSIILHGLHDEAVKLYTLREGELFGEMALIEQRPRSATVVATEPSTVLEINGDRFLPLMQKHNEIALYLLAKLSQRLRHIDDEIVTRRVKGLDETINILNNRVDAIVQTTDAKLAASQAMFVETNQRANEIIESAGRARSVVAWLAGIVTAVLTLVAWTGYSGLKNVETDMKDLVKGVQADKDLVETDKKVVEENNKTVDALAKETKNAASIANSAASTLEGYVKTAADYTKKTETLSKDVTELQKSAGETVDGIMLTALQTDIGQNRINDRTAKSYAKVVGSKYNAIQDQLFETMHDLILGSVISEGEVSPIKTIKTIGYKSLETLKESEGQHSAVITTYYFIILSDIVSYDKNAFDEDFESLDEYIKEHKGAFNSPFRLNEKQAQDVIKEAIKHKKATMGQDEQDEKSTMLNNLFAKLAEAL